MLAERGCVVVCGGLGEVMEAAARGAKDAGGTTVGILPGESTKDANPWIDYAIATGTGHARNLAVVASCEAAIAVGGRWGTAAEIAYARVLGRPVVVLGEGRGWRATAWSTQRRRRRPSSGRSGWWRRASRGSGDAFRVRALRCRARGHAEARICSFECTFCPACADAMASVCPNCGGELVRRPLRAR